MFNIRMIKTLNSNVIWHDAVCETLYAHHRCSPVTVILWSDAACLPFHLHVSLPLHLMGQVKTVRQRQASMVHFFHIKKPNVFQSQDQICMGKMNKNSSINKARIIKLYPRIQPSWMQGLIVLWYSAVFMCFSTSTSALWEGWKEYYWLSKSCFWSYTLLKCIIIVRNIVQCPEPNTNE